MTSNPRPNQAAAGPAVPRRGRGVAWVTVLLLVTLPAALGRGAPPETFVGAALTSRGLSVPPAMAAELEALQRSASLPVVANVAGIRIHAPAADPVIVGFHEASFGDALELRPVGTLATNDNTSKFLGGLDDLSGLPYVIQASRGRDHAATTAIDVVLDAGVAVLSPIDGLVTEVRDYELYGQYPDTRVEIQPDAAPNLRVVIIHLDGVTVEVGRRVQAGITQLASQAAAFGFESQIDRYAHRPGLGHVHLEVKPPGGRDEG